MTHPSSTFVKAARGVIYAVCGKRHLAECSVSITTLVKRSPSLPFVIFTDEPESWVGRSWSRENVMPLPREAITAGQEWMDLTGIKIEAIARSPFDKTLYLDVDTAVLGDVQPMFDLLSRFDIAAGECTHWFGQSTPETLRRSRAPLSFPEFNTGVLLLNSTSFKTKQFIATWKKIFQNNQLSTATRSSDQQAFREAAWASDVSIMTLRPNFNYLGQRGIEMPVVIAHKILNRHTMFPTAKPEELADAMSRIKEDDTWSLLCALAREGGTAKDFERLKQFDNFHAASRIIRFDSRGRVSRTNKGFTTANHNTTLPIHIISLYRNLKLQFAIPPARWQQRFRWSALRLIRRFRQVLTSRRS